MENKKCIEHSRVLHLLLYLIKLLFVSMTRKLLFLKKKEKKKKGN